MKFKNISKKLESEDVYNILIKNFSKLNADWVYHQWNWLHQNYSAFNDLIKYLITIALVRDTLKFYKDIGHTYNFNEYYSYPEFQIEKFSISNLAKEFRLPKETMRRKIIELEKLNIIRKKGKKVYFDRTAFDLVKPTKQIKITSKYLSKISEILFKEKKLDSKISDEKIIDIVEKNFSTIWLWFYEFQIPLMINWKDYFEDINTFYIWGTCGLNQVYNEKNRIKSEKIENLVLDKYLEKILKTSGSGLNVMSISEMTQIPRATVIRKVKYLENEKLIKSNSKKQYYLSDFTPFKISPKIKEHFKIKSTFVANVFNLIII